MRFRLVLSLLASLAALPLFAQTPAPQPAPVAGETINVSVANVDVVVVDGKGNPVRGLTKDDFHVLERGKERPITNFSEVVKPDPAAAPAPVSPTQGRRILFLFDNNSLTLAARKLVLPAARTFLSQLQPGDRALIATSDKTIRRLTGWTSDPGVINAALDQVANSVTLGGEDLRNAQSRIMQQINDAQQSGQRGAMVSFDTLVSSVREFAGAESRDAMQSMAAMQSALAFFPRTGGRKALVIAGAGLPLRPGAAMFQYLENLRTQAMQGNGPSIARGPSGGTSLFSEQSAFDLTKPLEQFAARAFGRGVAIYTLDPEMGQSASGAVEQSQYGGPDAAFAKVGNRMAGFQVLANESGGMAIIGRNPQDALAVIANDLQSYYSIGYSPSGTLTDPSQLSVKAKPGLRVRFTPAGGAVPREVEVKESVIANHVDKLANDLGIKLVADPPVADGDKKKVTVKVLIPVKSLKFTPSGNDITGGFDVYVSTGDAQGNASDVNKQSSPLRWPKDALPQLIEKSITFAVPVVLEPGRNQISVGVVDMNSQQVGYERITVGG